MDKDFERIGSESLEEYLWRVGTLKKRNEIDATWDTIADKCNEVFGVSFTESYFRKKFKRLVAAFQPPADSALYDTALNESAKISIREIEKRKMLLNDEKNSYRRLIRDEARRERFYDDMLNAIKKYEPVKVEYVERDNTGNRNVIYALLSDIHYGMEFNNVFGAYNAEIAANRLHRYANCIKALAEETKSDTCYLSLLGDLISGNIHPLLKAENSMDVTEQVVGVSNLICEFIRCIASSFKHVYVNSVSGNHSRIESNKDNAPRAERLDKLIPFYCKAALSNQENVEFQEEPEDSMSIFNIFGQNYLAVHGDFDISLVDSARNLSEVLGTKIDCVVAGHLHVPKMSFETIPYIQNGALLSGGDEYTVKKRLFARPYQVAMKVSILGVEAVYPIRL